MSKYNKKLPKPSEIRWMNSTRKTRQVTITMPFKGTIPSGVSYIGWRQSSYAYSYQVQYMVEARMIPDRQLETGTDTTKTAYKYPNSSWSGNVNTMNRCVTMDKKNRYYRYYNFAGRSLMSKGSYDKLTVTVRVRSFNKSKKQHGTWVTKKLYIKCKPSVTVYKIVALVDGGFRLFFNTNGWTRGDSKVILNDVRHDGATEKENKKALTDEVGAIGTEEASGYPYAEFAGSEFNAGFVSSEKIVLKNCVFRTVDGVDVSLDGTYTIDATSAVIDAPNVTITRDEDKGLITAKVAKSDANDDWDTVQAWMNCKLKDKTVRCDYSTTSGSGDATRYFTFRPPLDSEIELKIGIMNNLGGTMWKTYTQSNLSSLAPIKSNGRLIVNYTDGTDEQPSNGTFNGSKVAAMNYDLSYSTDVKRQYEKEMPFGRGKPIAFLGDGIEKTINLTGNIDGSENEEYKTVAFSGYYDWLNLQDQQGIVLARLPFGRTYTAVCTKLTIDQADEYDESRDISMTLEEVDI